MPAKTVSAPYEGIDWNTQIVLQSNDEPAVEFVVLREAAMMSTLIKDMLADQAPGEETVIPCPNVPGKALRYVIEYVEHHYNNKAEPIEKPLKTTIQDVISEWDKAFLYTDLIKGGVEKDHELLIDVIFAANFLSVKDLVELGCAAAASMIKGKTPQQIRDLFGIENDLTPEQEEKIREQNKECLEEN